MPKRPKQNSDHAQRHNTPTIDNEAIANQLKALLTPAPNWHDDPKTSNGLD